MKTCETCKHWSLSARKFDMERKRFKSMCGAFTIDRHYTIHPGLNENMLTVQTFENFGCNNHAERWAVEEDLIARTEDVSNDDLPKLYAAFIGNKFLAWSEDKDELWSWAELIGLTPAIEVRTYALHTIEQRMSSFRERPLCITLPSSIA